MDKARQRLKEIIINKSLMLGEFTLAGGAKSNYYLDLRCATLDPEGCHLIGMIINGMLEGWGISAVGGPTLGADPIVAAVAMTSFRTGNPVPAFIVRKATKEHGAGKLIEGTDIKGLDVAIVEDVVTKGGSVIHAIRSACAAGAKVRKVITVVDRLQGGSEKMNQVARELEQDFSFEPIFTIRDLGIEPE